MPRRAANANPETIIIPAAVWNELTSQLGTAAGLEADGHAVLIGLHDGAITTAHLAATDEEDETRRAEQRRYAGANDLDVVGQVHVTRERLDLTLARTSEEQRGRRQDQYSLPEGHVFLHIHRIAGHEVACAHVVRNHQVRPAILTIADERHNSSDKPERRAGRKVSGLSGPATTHGSAAAAENEAP
jgi:hypothetical protein